MQKGFLTGLCSFAPRGGALSPAVPGQCEPPHTVTCSAGRGFDAHAAAAQMLQALTLRAGSGTLPGGLLLHYYYDTEDSRRPPHNNPISLLSRGFYSDRGCLT
ncbi:unnamed protein product [Arctogadus glacialis]